MQIGWSGTIFSLLLPYRQCLKINETLLGTFLVMVIFLRSKEEHLNHIDIVLKTLAKFGLHLNFYKSQLFKTEEIFLRYHVNWHLVKPGTNKIDQIVNIKNPSNADEIRRLLRMIVFFRKFISDFAKKSLCLFDECAKFRGSHTIVGLRGSSQNFVGHDAMVPSRFCGYFVGPKFFLVVILWAPSIFSWFFVGFNIFACGCFVVKIFFSWVFRGSNVFSCGYFLSPIFFLVANFTIRRFPVVGCMRKCDRKRKYVNTSQTMYSISNRFQQLSVLFILERFFID